MPISIYEQWKKIAKIPGSRKLFWLILRGMNRYSSNIRPELVEWNPGDVTLLMRDRPALRNHLKSIHAIAMANFLELTSGLAVLSSLPEGIIGIPVHLAIDYKKKARGNLTCTSKVKPPKVTERVEFIVKVDAKDSAGNKVCTATVKWLLQPVT